MHLAFRYDMLVCHQCDVCKNYVSSVYNGGYDGLSESGLRVFRELYPVSFLVRLYSGLDTVVISRDDVGVVWCLVLWFVFSVMWFELLMTSAISCPLWSSVDEC